MNARVAGPRAVAKSEPSQNRNLKCRIRNLSVAVMQHLKEALKPKNVARELDYITEVPMPSVQKMMSGDRPVNLELIVGLLRSEYGREVLFILMDDANPEWFSKYQKLLDNNDLHRKMVEIERAIAAKNRELAQ
jgi:hypothetical protein